MIRNSPEAAPARVPVHIGFIMDGNGRWAKANNKTRAQGHDAGAKAFEVILGHCRSIGVRCATVYAFSTENWKRPKDELDHLGKLFMFYLDYVLGKLKSGDKGVFEKTRIIFIGEVSVFKPSFREKIARIMSETDKEENIFTVNIAINYGGRAEIVRSVNEFIAKNPNKIITEKDISDSLYTARCPDPDLIIRTAGEKRLSNFMLWQVSYSELYVTDIYWPEFSPAELDKAVAEYGRRVRNFGGLKSE